MEIVIQTQYRENYGAHDWDGKGECPQYWKCKGGSEYIVTEVPLEAAKTPQAVVEIARPLIESRSNYSTTDIVDFVLHDGEGYRSWFEKSQLEYEGKVTFWEPRLTYAQLLEKAAEASNAAVPA